MNKIVIEKDEVLYLDSCDYKIDINNGSKVVIYQFVFDRSVNVEVNLNKSGAILEYYYSTINYNDNNFKIIVNHNKSNTISNIYNHGINVDSNKLHFDISGMIDKNLKLVNCNQDNEIININNGKSTILPILYIDSDDIIANHSAYIGKFKDEVIFYLESRGISRDKAYKLLINGFLIPSNIDREKIKDFILKIEEL